MNQVLRVMIVDDQSLMRDGLTTILNTDPLIEVVGQASNGEDALAMVESILPDLVLMDVRMPIMNGVECTRIIKERFPDIRVIILTTFDDDNYIIDALSYGASGYLLKDMDGASLIRAVKDAALGNLLLPGAIANKLASRLSQQSEADREEIPNDNLLDQLTDRELEIVKRMLQGDSSKQIAEALFLTQGTVKNYITSIYSKVGTSDRVKALLILQKLNL